jgi:hypothetical protein
MKTRWYFFTLAGIILALLSGGCTFNVGYNPSYLPVEAMKLGITGKSLVVLSEVDEQWNFASKPTSFTGGGTTLTVPLGEITKEIALRVFGAAFKEGADFKNQVGSGASYRLIIQPKVNKFSYGYYQLKNAGLAITPTVDVELHVVLSSPDGKTLLDKVYHDGPTEGATYFVSGQPQEKINQLLHQTIFKHMTDAALDARKSLAD